MVFDPVADKLYFYANKASDTDSITPFSTCSNILKDANGTSRNIYGIKCLRLYFAANAVITFNQSICWDSFSVETTQQIDGYVSQIPAELKSLIVKNDMTSISQLYGSLKYYGLNSNGNVASIAIGANSEEAATQTYSVIKQTVLPKQLDAYGVDTKGGYLKWEIQNPTPGTLTDSNTFYNVWKNPKADSDGKIIINVNTDVGNLDSHILLSKRYKEDGTTSPSLPLVDANNNPLYKYLVFEWDIKTTSKYIGNNSFFTIRCTNASGDLLTENRVILGISHDANRTYTYLKTKEHIANGTLGYHISNDGAWHHLMMVIEFDADPRKNKVYYFCDGKFLFTTGKYSYPSGLTYYLFGGTEAIHPTHLDALRFNIQFNTDVYNEPFVVGDNICMDNVRVSVWDGKTKVEYDDVDAPEIPNYTIVEDYYNGIESEEWIALIESKRNWTIALG